MIFAMLEARKETRFDSEGEPFRNMAQWTEVGPRLSPVSLKKSQGGGSRTDGKGGAQGWQKNYKCLHFSKRLEFS